MERNSLLKATQTPAWRAAQSAGEGDSSMKVDRATGIVATVLVFAATLLPIVTMQLGGGMI